MTISAVCFTVSLLSVVLLTPAIRAAAQRWGLLDHALSSRKIHGKPIPRLGGVAIVAGFFAALAGALLLSDAGTALLGASSGDVASLCAGAAVIAALGLYDDLHGSGARTKFAVQFLVAGFLYWRGFRIDTVALPFLGMVELGPLGCAVTLLWIAGVANALNLIDGLDGLAGGIALVATAVTFVIAAGNGDAFMMLVAAALAGALVGFLVFNFNPASIFMGDTGSLFLGFLLAATAIRTHHKASTAVSLLVPVIVLALPIGDTLLSMARRWMYGMPMFAADRGHIHHRILARGYGQRQTVLVLWATAVALALVALFVSRAGDHAALLAVGGLGVVALLALRALGYFRLRRVREVLARRRRNLEVRGRIDEIAARLQTAAEPIALWETVADAAPVLGADHVALEISCPTSGDVAYALGPETAEMVRSRHRVRPQCTRNVIQLGWTGRTAVDRDTEIAVELLCGHLRSALDRMEGRRSLPAEAANGLARIIALRR